MGISYDCVFPMSSRPFLVFIAGFRLVPGASIMTSGVAPPPPLLRTRLSAPPGGAARSEARGR